MEKTQTGSTVPANTPAPVTSESSFDSSEEPPGSGRRHPVWNHVPLDQWQDWRWQMQNAIRTTRQLSELLPLSPAEMPALEQLESQYKLAIPPYYFSLIDTLDPRDPIRLQSVPSGAELAPSGGQELEDPLEEDQDSPVPGLTHRYPDRVLMVTTHVCSMYCRFCTRKRVTMDRTGWDAPSRNDQRMVDYIREHEEVHDVIVSGGDPLSLPVSKLSWLVKELAAIDHVSVIRLGTRVPVTLPQRIFDTELVDLLHQAGKIWIQTHFNHPSEITPESTRAIRLLVNAGMPVNNHAVLLKGVNDSVPVMRTLLRGLLRIKVRPYYLFHCDPVVGAGHFRTSVWKGLEIMEGLRGHISGLGVPTYVVDGLHGAGKIPVMPNYLLSASEDSVVLRNYEGLIFRYAPEHRDEPQAQTYESLGVSNLLGGSQAPLVPAGNRRLARRKQREEAAEANGHEAPDVLPLNGLVALNGHSSEGHGSNGQAAATNGNGHATNGNGSTAAAGGRTKRKPANGYASNGQSANGRPAKAPAKSAIHRRLANPPMPVASGKLPGDDTLGDGLLSHDGAVVLPTPIVVSRRIRVSASHGSKPPRAKLSRIKATPQRKSAPPSKTRRPTR
jgi:lysine 2,3-aminomutase